MRHPLILILLGLRQYPLSLFLYTRGMISFGARRSREPYLTHKKTWITLRCWWGTAQGLQYSTRVDSCNRGHCCDLVPLLIEGLGCVHFHCWSCWSQDVDCNELSEKRQSTQWGTLIPGSLIPSWCSLSGEHGVLNRMPTLLTLRHVNFFVVL